ncbi:MAG TPA: hypothetical protein VGK06_12055, partial [Methanosarcina sp.]
PRRIILFQHFKKPFFHRKTQTPASQGAGVCQKSFFENAFTLTFPEDKLLTSFTSDQFLLFT